MNSTPEDFEKINCASQLADCSSKSSLSDEDREQEEHVLKYDAERIVVLNEDAANQSPVLNPLPSSNASWVSKILSSSSSMLGNASPSSSSQATTSSENTGKQQKKKWMTRLLSTWNNIKYSSTWMPDRSADYCENDVVVFLARRYSTIRDANGFSAGFEEFCSDYYSRIWITYRTGFAPLLNTDVTTDCGWGCMLRTTQMMMAHCIMLNKFGRDWRFVRWKNSYLTVHGDQTSFDRAKMQEWAILKLFEDEPLAPLGIHRMIEIASIDKREKAVRSWYSPSEAVFIMKRAISESSSPLTADIAMYLSTDGRVHIRDIEVETKNWMKTLVLVIIVRLGTTQLNPIYLRHLMRLFSMESCLGVTGGRPNHSTWFVGFSGNQIIYLDPHVVHEYIPIDLKFNADMSERSKTQKKCPERSYHCRLLSKMNFLDMDPSCALCFRFESREQFDRDMLQLNLNQCIDIDQGEENGMKRVRDPIFCVEYGERRQAPSYHENFSEVERDQANKQGFEML